MRVIIAGSRTICDGDLIAALIENTPIDISQVVSGGARGVDSVGSGWAKKRGIPVVFYRPNWDLNKRAAGPIRNREMAENADALILIWDGKSRGSKNMLETARELGLIIAEYVLTEGELALGSLDLKGKRNNGRRV